MTKQAHPYLILINQALDQIMLYKPVDLKAFLEDAMCQDAVAMRLQEIGENLARIRDITPDYYNANAEDSWNKIIGLRNLISHGYYLIQQEQIWDILENHLPPFSERIEALLAKLPSEQKDM